MKITRQLWGNYENKDIWLFEVDNQQGGIAHVSNYGGVLQSLYVKTADGESRDVVLGYDTLQEYIQSETFFGAMVGPVADRLDSGRMEVGQNTIQLPLNAGPDSMHSGPRGFHAQVWDWEILDDGVAFTRVFEKDEYGYPGNLQVRLAYRFVNANTLRLEYAAQSDAQAAVSFTNHSYFSLNSGVGTCENQVLCLYASRYAQTERESDPICTGRMIPVEGTPFDMRSGCRIGDVLACGDFSEIRTGGGIDHFFIVDGEGMRVHAEIISEENKMKLICRSDAPGVLVYSANGLENEKGKGGKTYCRNAAVCLETERFPNAVNFPHLRDQVILNAGEIYESATEYSFEAI